MEFGMFYEVQVPRPASPEAEHQRLREIVDQVVLAEEMGFDEVWFVEHHFLTEWAHSSASEVMLAVLSQHTTKMRLGCGRNSKTIPRSRGGFLPCTAWAISLPASPWPIPLPWSVSSTSC